MESTKLERVPGFSSLLVAADCGALEEVKTMISAKADVNEQNPIVNGNRSYNPDGAPLHYAAR